MFIKLCLNCSGSEGICCGQLVAVGCWSLCCSIWSLHIYLGNWGILTSLLSQCHFFVCFPSLGQTSYLFLRVLITSRKTWQIHNLEKKKIIFFIISPENKMLLEELRTGDKQWKFTGKILVLLHLLPVNYSLQWWFRSDSPALQRVLLLWQREAQPLCPCWCLGSGLDSFWPPASSTQGCVLVSYVELVAF